MTKHSRAAQIYPILRIDPTRYLHVKNGYNHSRGAITPGAQNGKNLQTGNK